ncbi:MAG: methionyl-tRNA formyltransferase [Pseudomonadota bacterium]|nr:methionyl-tRNA formyltransferase [Pseudomonadota bacterium]
MGTFRLAFMGTPDFAVPTLHELAAAGHDIAAVYCQPAKPAGRGQQLRKSPVQRAAEEMGVEIRTPRTLRDTDEQRSFAELKLDIAVVVAYGLILPQPVLDAPRNGCINIHGSLLPRWRGAAPIQRALLAGDEETGITIMQMDAGLDTGAMLSRAAVAISPKTTAGMLHDELMHLGARLIRQTLAEVSEGRIQAQPQPITGVTYAAKLTREEGRLDWNKSAEELERQVRAFSPWPGSFLMVNNEAIKVLAAEIDYTKSDVPGTLLDDNFTVSCGHHALHLIALQRPGKNPTDGSSLLRGLRLTPGTRIR